jgi:triphosphoribosyl-dephospho-CoA synthetase
MFAATGGVNTHKGLIFSLGVLCAACGMLVSEGKHTSPEACAGRGAEIVRGIVERDFTDAGKKKPSERTAGERLYLAEGVTGIRGEAERGFPAVIEVALPCLRKLLSDGAALNDALAETLLLLMTATEDTNILARGGREGERNVREAARNALDLGGMRTEEGVRAVREMEVLFTSSRLSPGGAADLLAVTVFLHLMETSGATEAIRRARRP